MYFILGSQLIWGIAGPLVKIILETIPPFSLMYLRFLFASIILFLIYELKLVHQTPVATSDDRKNIFLAGFFGVFLNIFFYFWAQTMTTVTDAWVIASTGTLFVVGLSYFWLGVRLSIIVYLGVGLAFLGTLTVMGSSITQFGKGGFLGNFLMLLAVFSGAISFFYTKKVINKFSALTLTFWWFLIGLIFSFPLFLWDYFKNPGWMTQIKLSDLGILTYIVLGSSIGAYYLSNLGLKTLSPSLAATLGYTSSIIAIGLSILFLGERPTHFFLVGSVFIIIGLFLAETRHPGHPIHKLLRK